MRKVLAIAAREYRAAVKTKSFVIGIILLPIMMGGGFFAQLLFKDQIDLRPKHFAILDRTPGQTFFPLLAEATHKRNQEDSAAAGPTRAPLIVESVPVPEDGKISPLRLALSDRVRAGKLIGFLEIGPEILRPSPLPLPRVSADEDEPAQAPPESASVLEPHALRYQTNRPAYQEFSKWAQALVTAAVHARRAQKKGVSPADLHDIVQPVPMLTKGLSTRDAHTGAIQEARAQNPVVAFLLPGGLLILMFMVVLLGAAPLLNGVIEEKMQRIAEVLLGSVQPFQLMMGKLIGMCGVSLTMATVYLAGAFWAVQHYGYGEYLSVDIMVWFLVYQVLALLMFGSIYAAVGAACTDLKEAQAMATPVSLISMIPLFLWCLFSRSRPAPSPRASRCSR
jgi:ABC-2 type transport system permease protein